MKLKINLGGNSFILEGEGDGEDVFLWDTISRNGTNFTETVFALGDGAVETVNKAGNYVWSMLVREFGEEPPNPF